MLTSGQRTLASIAALLAPASALAAAPASQARTEAVVIADVVDQLYIEPAKVPPGYITTDGLYRDSLKIKRVISGPLRKGPLAVNGVAHTYMDRDWARNREFKLRRDEHGEWWVESGK